MKKLLRITVSLILVAILLVMAMPLYALEEVSVKEIEELRRNIKQILMPTGRSSVPERLPKSWTCPDTSGAMRAG